MTFARPIKTKMAVSAFLQQALAFRDERDWAQWHHPKTLGIGLFVEAGELAEHFLYHRDHELADYLQRHLPAIAEELVDVLYWLLIISHEVGFGLDEAFLHKMRKNLIRNDEKNYTAVVMELPESVETFTEMIDIIQEFRTQRGWAQNLEPRDLLYKLIEEIGEVCEYFQWQHGDDLVAHLAEHRQGLSEEVADSLVCVLLLALSLNVDLEAEFARKMDKNRQKYPV